MHRKSFCTAKLILTTFLVISVALLIVSLVLKFKIIPDIIENQVNKNVRLEENTEQFDRFVDLPFPIDFKVYIFHVENPQEIMSGSTPILKEIGPFVYRQNRSKSIEGMDDDEDTISYNQTLTFEFDSEASGNLSDTDIVTVLNAPMMSILQMAESLNMANIVGNCIQSAFSGYEDLFVELPVKTLLFDGLNFCKLNIDICYPVMVTPCVLAKAVRNIDVLEDNSLLFSYFNYKVRDNDGLYTVKRGIKDITQLGSIIRLNHETHTSYWGDIGSNTTCDEVRGTDSTLYPPRVTKDSVIDIYSTDICRYVTINFKEEAIYKGVDGYLFQTDESTLQSSTANKEDDCFCTNLTLGTDGASTCFLDGVIDMQPCFGVPVLLSFPHFLWADKSYGEAIEGLSPPNEDTHRTFLLVEPNTGTPLQGMKRIQMNSVLRPIGDVSFTQNLKRLVLPLLWVEEGLSLNDEYLDKLDDLYFSKVKIASIVQWVCVGVSTVLTITFAALLLRKEFC